MMRQPAGHPYDVLDADELRGRGSIKWRHHPPGVLAAWVAEMDFPLAPPIREALVDAIDRGYTGYPPLDAATGVPEALSGWLAARYKWNVAPERIRLLPDVLRGVNLGIRLLSAPGTSVVLPTPAYPPFFETIASVGRTVIEVPLVQIDDRLTFDLPAIDAALRDGAGTVIVCNPQNPVGRVFGREELEGVADVVARHGARVVADEVHAPLVYDGVEFVPYASVSEEAADHSVTLTSASKGWNIPGLKCAQAVLTNDADLQRWNQLPFVEAAGVSTLGIVATVAAYEHGTPWLEDTLDYLDRNRRLLHERLAEALPEVGFVVPQGTYLAWLDCRSLELEFPSEFFLDHARVSVNEGAAFGVAGRGHVRLNFATSRAILDRVVAAMASALHTE